MKKRHYVAPVAVVAVVAAVGAAVAVSARAEDSASDFGSLVEEAPTEQARGGSHLSVSNGARPNVVPEFYDVQRGDTLEGISERFYGTRDEWPRIWSYNPTITNPHWIYPVGRIRLAAEGQVAAAATLPGRPRFLAVGGSAMDRGAVLLQWEGYLDREALENAGVILGAPEPRMMLSAEDDLYFRVRGDRIARAGDELTIFRRMFPQERAIGEEGELVRIFGAVRVESYDATRRVGRARIVEAIDPIERGFSLAPMPRRFLMVSRRPTARNIEAKVIAALRPRRLMAEQLVVFVNVGQDQGVEVGNEFMIVRNGDPWRENLTLTEEQTGAIFPAAERLPPALYPTEIIAVGRAVDVRRSTTGLLLTYSAEEVEYGARAVMRAVRSTTASAGVPAPAQAGAPAADQAHAP